MCVGLDSGTPAPSFVPIYHKPGLFPHRRGRPRGWINLVETVNFMSFHTVRIRVSVYAVTNPTALTNDLTYSRVFFDQNHILSQFRLYTIHLNFILKSILRFKCRNNSTFVVSPLCDIYDQMQRCKDNHLVLVPVWRIWRNKKATLRALRLWYRILLKSMQPNIFVCTLWYTRGKAWFPRATNQRHSSCFAAYDLPDVIGTVAWSISLGWWSLA